MRFVLREENAVAFAYKLQFAVEVSKEPQLIQEQHTFFAGQKGEYIAIDITSKTPDNWSEGMNVIRRSVTNEPEVFLQDLLPDSYIPSENHERYAAIWKAIRSKVQWRDRGWTENVERAAIDFATEVLTKMLALSFQDLRFNSREVVQRLQLGDSASVAKFQVVCLTVVSFLIKRAAREALLINFGSHFKDLKDFNRIAVEADSVANSIIEQQLKNSVFPSYVDLNYFRRWDHRYHDAATQSPSSGLRHSTLNCALRHATFAYQEEGAVLTKDSLMLKELSDIYDAYVGDLRAMLRGEYLQ
jgi:hypothetical protein